MSRRNRFPMRTFGLVALVACGSGVHGPDVTAPAGADSNAAGADGGAGAGALPSSQDMPSSVNLPPSRQIGGATLDPSLFWPPTGQSCETKLDPAGTVPTAAPQAFLDECSGCHGPTAMGRGTYPSIRGARTFDAFQTIVRGGIVTPTLEMPFFKTAWLNDDDLRRIYAFLTASPIVETKVCTPLPVLSAADIA